MAYIGKSPSTGIRNRFIYTATAGQTTFSGSDDHSRTLNYNDAEFTDVFLNGVKLDKSDYTATSGTSIVLDEGAAVDDIVEVLAFDTFSVFSGEFSQDVTVGGTLDVQGGEVILDADGDTSITADTDDRIDFKTGGTDRMVINASGYVGLGTTSPDRAIKIHQDNAYVWVADAAGGNVAFMGGSGSNDGFTRLYNGSHTAKVEIHSNADSYFDGGNVLVKSGNELKLNRGDNTRSMNLYTDDDFGTIETTTDPIKINAKTSRIQFEINGDEKARVTSGGDLNTTGVDAFNRSNAGFTARAGDSVSITRNGGTPLEVNRGTNDGPVIGIHQNTTTEGTISVSGSTVSYNGFTGTHWTRLSDGSNPTILRGTVLESIGTMMDWYQAEFTVGSGDDAETVNMSVAKPSGKNVGDTFTFTVPADNDVGADAGDVTATLRQETDVKHVKCKVSDTSESKAVYGVFNNYDPDDLENDIIIASVGTSVVRILSTETVAIGDLLDSNGDGTAKVQSDDIIRSRTIGKVLSTVKQETYSDGSYTVPCALYCG